MDRPRRLLGYGILLSLLNFDLCGASSLLAAPGIQPFQSARIELTLVGSLGDSEALGQVIREWLERPGTSLILKRSRALAAEKVLDPPPSPNTLRIWLVLASQERARLYFADPERRRYLVRDVNLRDGLDETGREQVAQILVSSVSAFEEREASSSAEEVERTFLRPASVPAPAIPPSSSSAAKPSAAPPQTKQPQVASDSSQQPRFVDGSRKTDETNRPTSTTTKTSALAPGSSLTGTLGLGLRYDLVSRGEAGLGHGPALAVGALAKNDVDTWSLFVMMGFEFPVTLESDSLRLELERTPMASYLGYARRLAPRWALGGEVGLRIDYLSFQPFESSLGDIEAMGRGHDLIPHLQIGTLLDFMHGSWQLGVRTFVLLPFIDSHYDVIRQGRRQAEIAPARLQPGIGLEARFD